MILIVCRSVRARQAALDCVRKATRNLRMTSKPKIVLVTDTPTMVKDIAPSLGDLAEVTILYVLLSLS